MHALCALVLALLAQPAPSQDFAEDAAQWRGAEASGEHVKTGQRSLRWDFAKGNSVATDAMPKDWSGYNTLRFWVWSAKSCRAQPSVIVSSEDPDSEGIDYFAAQFPLDFEGWREIILPFDEIGPVRKPVGWQKIDGFMLHARWDPNAPYDDEEVLWVDDLRLTAESSVGPRMTDEQFFDALDLSLPGLGGVKDAVASGDLVRAKHAFCQYLRQRRKPTWFTDWRERPKPKETANTAYADEILTHTWRLRGYDAGPYDFGDRIDWSSNPMTKGESATVEWNAGLNRHFHIQALAQAYWDTGDEKHAREAVAQMVGWIEDCPVLLNRSGNSPYHYAWETLNTACRAGQSWPDILYKVFDSAALDDESLIKITKSLAEHARHLMHYPSGGNWLTMESTAILYVGTLFPEYREAPEWRRTGIERLYGQLDREVYPDGLEIELAWGYNAWVLRNFGDVVRFLNLNGRADELPADFEPKIEKMYDYACYASDPQRRVPGLNDSGDGDVRSLLERGHEQFPSRTDFLWVSTDGQQGAQPAATSRAFPYSGHYVMRSGWDREARYLLFDAGPFGYGHQHEDKLTLVVHAYGKRLIPDAGNYMYDRSRRRQYVLSTRGHNTVRVDRQDQSRRRKRDTYMLPYPFQPLANPWSTQPGLDFAQGCYDDGYGPDGGISVVHTRAVFFVKPEYWVTLDHLQPADQNEHDYQALFHLDVSDAALDEGASVCRTADDGPGLTIWPCSGLGVAARVVKGQEEPEFLGWSSGPWRAVPTAVYEKRAKGATWMAYVLYPTPAAARAPIRSVESLPMPDGSALGVTVTFADGRRDQVVWAPAPTALRFAGFEATGRAALMRLDAQGAVSSSSVVAE